MASREKQHYIYKITCQESREYYYGKRSCVGSWKEAAEAAEGETP